MGKVLVSWIGGNDLTASQQKEERPEVYGPLLSTLLADQFSNAYLLYNYPKDKVVPYVEWRRCRIPVMRV